MWLNEETGRRYERTVTNVAPYRPTSAVPRDGFKHEQDRVQIGDMVAVKDDNASDEVWIARVLGVDADTVECHYWSTTSSSNNAVFKPTYVGLSSGKTILTYRLRASEEPTKLWTGTYLWNWWLLRWVSELTKEGNIAWTTQVCAP